jgi:hypothetical protein
MARNCATTTTDSLINASIPLAASTGTMAFWFKPNWSSVNGQTFDFVYWAKTGTTASTDARIQIQHFNDNNIYAGPFKMDGSTDARAVVADAGLFVSGTWNHQCVVWDQPGNSVIYYVNGVSKATAAAGPAFTQSCTYAVAGNHPFPWGGTTSINGAVADVGFWTIKLTPSEVLALAKGARCFTIREPSLAWYLPVDGLVSPEPDFSGNAANATVTGTTSVFGPPITLFTPRGPSGAILPTSAGGGGAIKFRRSLSELGTRTGSRQRQVA